MAYRDAFAYREIADSLNDGLNTAKEAINNQNDAINRANQTIKTQSETLDAQKSDNDKLNAQIGKLERKNKFWTTYAGVMTFIAVVSTMIILK